MKADDAKRLLDLADVTFGDDWRDDDEKGKTILNMNDTFGWALAWGEEVPESELAAVASLFVEYGSAGLYYWVSEQHDKCSSEFEDVQRRIEFVRHEEGIKRAVQGSTQRAYHKAVYSLGAR